MALYESTFIFRQDIPVSEVNSITASLSKLVVDNGGSVLKTEYWGLRELAYIIKKNKKGHYVMLVIDAPNRAVQELLRKTKLSEDIIRTLFVSIESFDGADSVRFKESKEGSVNA